ncbi:MAG TPA: DUF898 family protein [Stellaceae bacterium]
MTITSDRTGAAGPSARIRAGHPEEGRLVYDGRTGELFVLWLKVLLLGIVTLGIYSRFWGRTRIRKYFWSHVSLLDERFEYDGTGGELFRRFLMALVLFPLIFGLGFGVGWLLVRLGVPAKLAPVLGLVVQFSVLIFVVFVSQYGSRRYQLSRTLWHGIRGGVEGSAASYAFRAIGYTLLLPITLGLAAPWRYVGLWRYKTRHTGFGDMNFHFDGSARRLVGPFLVAYAASILGLLLAALIGGGLFFLIVGMPQNPQQLQQHGGAMAGAIAAFYLTYIITSIIGYLHYFARAFGYIAENTHFGRVCFAFPVRKRDLFWFQFGNVVLLVITAGLAMAFVGQRYVRFFCTHLKIYAVNELAALSQAPGRRRPKGGEGLAQLFDTLDVGGFI